MQSIQSDLHVLWFLMLDSEENGQYDGLELVGAQLKEAAGAMLYDLSD